MGGGIFMSKNYYDLLGVSIDASDEEIIDSIRLLKPYGCEMLPGVRDRILEIREVEIFLRDPIKRFKYNIKIGLDYEQACKIFVKSLKANGILKKFDELLSYMPNYLMKESLSELNMKDSITLYKIVCDGYEAVKDTYSEPLLYKLLNDTNLSDDVKSKIILECMKNYSKCDEDLKRIVEFFYPYCSKKYGATGGPVIVFLYPPLYDLEKSSFIFRKRCIEEYNFQKEKPFQRQKVSS